MSKALKTVVSVAAAIAIPFAAPAIASSIGLSAAIGGAVGSATVGSVVGGALTGAALGMAKGIVLGEDAGRSALMGGIGGAIAGYGYTPTAAPVGEAAAVGVGEGTTSGAVFDTMGQGPEIWPSSMGASTSGAPFTPVDAMGQGPEIWPSSMGEQVAATPIMDSMGQGAEVWPASMGGQPAGLDMATSTAGAEQAAAVAKAPTTFSEAMKAKFTDPKAQADLVLRAAGQLAGAAIAGTGMSSEEQALLDQQTADLRKLQQENEGLFRQRLEQAQNLIGESRYFDPEYFGLQRARQAQTGGAIAKRAGLRGLEGERRAAESRRYDIETGRRTGTAYDVGYGTGVQGRLGTMQAGLSALPSAYPSLSSEYTALRGAYDAGSKRAREQAGNIGSLFGTLTGR